MGSSPHGASSLLSLKRDPLEPWLIAVMAALWVLAAVVAIVVVIDRIEAG